MDETTATGVLTGLACGDALGRPVEFQAPALIREAHGRVDRMLADGTHGQPAGTVTDDTEMAVRLARSLVERGGFEPADVADRYVDWYDGDPFDVGLITADALRRIRRGEGPATAGRLVWEERAEGSNAGNGSLMRCAPVGVAFADDRPRLVETAREESAITHADPRCRDACAALCLAIAELGAAEPPAPATAALEPARSLPDLDAEVRGALDRVVDGASTLRNSGYVVSTLEAGLHHGLTADTAEEAVVDAVMLGGDADTIGAIAGAVAGARFGADALPERWLAEIDERDELERLARRLR